MAKRILIIDDESGIRLVLGDIFKDEGFIVVTAEDGLKGLEALKREAFNLIFLDVWLPGMGGIDVLRQIKMQDASIPVVLISGHATVDIAVKAIKMGAFDFIEKPVDMDKALTVCRNALALSDLTKENQALKQRLLGDEIIGESKAIENLKTMAAQAAKNDSRCLITGENGVGKELAARLTHALSARAAQPFIEVNCAAIPESLIESELFGHEKGAFTGALQTRRGKFELAHKGSIFLDEVGDLSLPAQAKLLRVCQNLAFHRVGGEQPIKTDARIIAATNKNLKEEIAKGAFREDLFFRLNVIPIYVPPLRDRARDIPLLLEFFTAKFDKGRRRGFSSDALKKLKAYSWPGNIRELKNFCERLCVMCEEEEFALQSVQLYLSEAASLENQQLKPWRQMKLGEAKEDFEKALLVQALQEAGGSLTQASEKLGIYPSNLHAKIKKYGIDLKR